MIECHIYDVPPLSRSQEFSYPFPRTSLVAVTMVNLVLETSFMLCCVWSFVFPYVFLYSTYKRNHFVCPSPNNLIHLSCYCLFDLILRSWIHSDLICMPWDMDLIPFFPFSFSSFYSYPFLSLFLPSCIHQLSASFLASLHAPSFFVTDLGAHKSESLSLDKLLILFYWPESPFLFQNFLLARESIFISESHNFDYYRFIV